MRRNFIVMAHFRDTYIEQILAINRPLKVVVRQEHTNCRILIRHVLNFLSCQFGKDRHTYDFDLIVGKALKQWLVMSELMNGIVTNMRQTL